MNGQNDKCKDLEDQLAGLEEELAAWRAELEAWERGETSISKSVIVSNIRRLLAQVAAVGRQLEECRRPPPPPPPPSPPLTIAGIEQTQAIQFFRSRFGSDNAIPLVAGKETVLRVYVDVVSPRIGNLSGVAMMRTAGSSTWYPPLTPYNANAPVTPRRAASIERGNANHTLNFRIFPEYCQGALEVVVWVFDAAHPQEAGFTTSTSRILTFTKVGRLKLRLVRIRYSNAARGFNLAAPTIADFWRTAQFTLSTYPIPGIELLRDSEELYDGDFTSFWNNNGSTGTTGSIWAILERVRAAETFPAETPYLALVPPPPANQVGARGWAVNRMAIARVFDGAAMAQEVAHVLGRFCHAPCGTPPGACSDYPNYSPHPSGSIGEFGFDTRASAVFDPATTFDFMSYCGPVWVSPYTYEGLLPTFRSQLSASTRVRPVLEEESEMANHLYVYCRIYRDGKVVLLRQCFHTKGPACEVTGVPTPYFIELHGHDDRVLEARRIHLADPHRTLDDAWLDFPTSLPWHSEATRLVFKREDQVLHALDIEGAAPEILMEIPSAVEPLSGTHPVSWVAKTGDENLKYTLRYSNDGGRTWQFVVGGLTTNEYQVSLDALPGGEECFFQVLASDGILTSVATSTPFAVSRKPWQVTILSPANGDSAVLCESVHLLGFAHSVEGGSQEPEDLVWSSSIDGRLGLGPEVTVHTLSLGRHRITLTGNDGRGGDTSASVVITVRSARV